jgi:hypothetical protein
MNASPGTGGSRSLSINEGLRAVAGLFILLSVALGVWVNPWFFAFTAFVGLNLLQSAFTRWCPMMWVLGKTGCRAD